MFPESPYTFINHKTIPRDMKLSQAYELAIKTGIKHDPRPKEEIERVLREAKDARDGAKKAKKHFDEERLWNPYADSRFSWGDGDAEVSRILWGIDIGTGEMVLADRLREKGERVDAVVGHHPLGLAKTSFPEVMWMQTDMYHEVGMPINVAEGIMAPRMKEVLRNVMGSNYNQSVDAGRLLGMPIMNIHTPADNCVQSFLEKKFSKEDPKRLKEIIDRLMEEPEFKIAAEQNSPPNIICGDPNGRCGKVIFKMTGGTSGPKEVYEKMSQAGVGTIVGMHFPDSHIDEAKKHNVNLVISGHMASDSLGINIIADVWEKKGIETVPFSGLIRVSRN